jgi:hypothetical protein
MGNNPTSITDPDGGCEKCPENAANGATHTAPNGVEFVSHDGIWAAKGMEVTVTGKQGFFDGAGGNNFSDFSFRQQAML